MFDRIPQIERAELMRDGVNYLADLMLDTLPLPGARPGWVMNFVKRCSFYHTEATDSLPTSSCFALGLQLIIVNMVQIQNQTVWGESQN